jgi:hypothetical protein
VISEVNEEEVDDIVARAAGNVDDNGDFDLDGEPGERETSAARMEPTRSPKRRGRKRKNGGEDLLRDAEGSPEREMTIAELGAKTVLSDELPKPVDKVKTLGSMQAKFGIGQNPEFKAQVHRTYPKMFPGGHKADGFYDTWDQPLTEELLQSEYGGGTYRIVVIGPNPDMPNGTRYYDSITIPLAGDPNVNRQPMAMKDKEASKDASLPSPLPLLAAPENPKLAEQAMKIVGDVADRERVERHRAEDRAEERVNAAMGSYQPIIDAERRRADDITKLERERADIEKAHYEQRERESRSELEELRRKMEHIIDRPTPSFADELGKLKNAGFLGNNENSTMAQVMLEKILEKHRGEMESMSRQNATFVEQLRSGHASEIQAMRAAYARELEAEREAGRSRETRVEERLSSEREERRRDSDRYREVLAERDQQWKDRLEQARESLNTNWDARHLTVVGAKDTQIAFLQAELDRLKTELLESRQKNDDQRDPIAQLERLGEMREHITKALGVEKPSAPSGGIGLGGAGGGDWKEVAVEGLVDRFPAILDKLGGIFGNGGGGQQQPQQQYVPGQLVQTPQGEMVVVQTPQGLMLAPRAAVEQQRAAGMGNMLPPNAPRRTSAKPGKPTRRTAARKPEKKISVTQNFAADLPKRRPPWEGGGDEPDEDDSGGGLLDETPASVLTRPEPPREAPDAEPIALNAMERQGIIMIAKHVHESVMQADEPEEFVAKMIESYPANVISQVIGGYTTDQILKAVRQVAPNGAGSTPAGQQFVRAAIQLLRQKLAEGA